MTTDLKKRAHEIADRLYGEGTPMQYRDYAVIVDALEEIEVLPNRDEELEDLWAQFSDIPMNPETECMEEQFLAFPAGTHREEIWKWFDRRHSKGVAYLMYSDGVDRTPESAKLLYLKQLCFECESPTCQFNHGVECRFALVHGRKPLITDNDGCLDYAYREERGR